MSAFAHRLPAIALALSASACSSATRPPPASLPETSRASQLDQQQTLITRALRQQRRVDDVGYRLLAGATPFCAGALASGAGLRFANIESFPFAYQDAARALGFSDTLVVVSVARTSAAARASVAIGDRVIGVNDGPAPRGPNAAPLIARTVTTRGMTPSLTLRRGDTTFLVDARTEVTESAGLPEADRRVSVPGDTLCGYNLIASRKDEIHAWADGSNVTVTSAMLRFVTDNDELAALLAHEIAHNALGHIKAQAKNSIDGPFGAVVDTSAQATVARGAPNKKPLDVGSLVFTPDQERDADQVAMYLLARAERPTAEIANLWRHMAQQNPATVRYAGAHPVSRTRLAALERLERELGPRVARGEIPRPEHAAGDAIDDVESLATYELSAGDSVSYSFGPPVPRNGLTLGEVRRRAIQAYQDGNEAIELRLYAQAEAKYREAVLYDGGEARYHAALGATLLKRGKRAEAEAVLSAAVLLDVNNAEYRRLLVDARQHDR